MKDRTFGVMVRRGECFAIPAQTRIQQEQLDLGLREARPIQLVEGPE